MPQVFLLTGSSRGLGRQIAEAALAAGHQLVATARQPQTLSDLADRYGTQILPVALDVTAHPSSNRPDRGRGIYTTKPVARLPSRMSVSNGQLALGPSHFQILMTDPRPPRSHHDMGGRPAGAVAPMEHDYALWEKRVDALMMLLSSKDRGLLTVDEPAMNARIDAVQGVVRRDIAVIAERSAPLAAVLRRVHERAKAVPLKIDPLRLAPVGA